MNKPSGQGGKVLLVILGVAAVGALLYVMRPGSSTEKPIETQPIAVKPVEQPPPKPVEPPKEEPKPAEQPADADAVKAALLGLDKKPQNGGIAELAERASQRSTTAVRTRRRPVEDDDQPLVEDKTIGLSDSAFYSTIERWRGVKSCLTTGAVRADDGEPKGALRISLKINKAGEVTDSRVSEPSNEIARLIAPCVERSARQLRFPAFDGEETVTKVAKFVF